MSETESPQLRRERLAGVGTVALVCLALPSVLLMVFDTSDATNWREAMSWFLGSFAAGVLVPTLYWSSYHALGFAPIAALVWLVAVVVDVATVAGPGHWMGWSHGLPLGIMLGAAVRGRRGPDPVEGMAGVSVACLVGIVLAWTFLTHSRAFDFPVHFLATVALALVIWSWTRLFRPLFELSLEPVVWVMYKIRVRGKGVAGFPRTGPCVVMANHACWFDPLFLAKVLPRPLTPMMTSRFYDLPVVRKLMVTFGVIRVPDSLIRHDTPEIEQAIAALDRGECLLIFPEGYLRRTEERPLRRFGQGIWKILQARPDTPVVACWIEGGWGSYTSHFTGPPTKNKRPDFRRPIGIGVSDTVTVPTETLSEHLHTRIYLMNLTEAARVCLDLPELPPFQWHGKDHDDPDETHTPAA